MEFGEVTGVYILDFSGLASCAAVKRGVLTTATERVEGEKMRGDRFLGFLRRAGVSVHLRFCHFVMVLFGLE